MIYILTGIAKSGKSFLSNELLNRRKISVFSTDYIMMMLHHGESDLNLDINASDRTVSKKLEPYIYGLIKTMVENKENHLIEGVHFTPEFSRRLLKEFPNEIQIVYLCYKSISIKDKVNELYQYQNHLANDWIFHHNGERVEDIVAYMIEESKKLFTECARYELNCIDVLDINTQKKEIINILLNE